MNMDERARVVRGEHDAVSALCSVAEMRRDVWTKMGNTEQAAAWADLLAAFQHFAQRLAVPVSVWEYMKAHPDSTVPQHLGAWTSPSGQPVTVAMDVVVKIN